MSTTKPPPRNEIRRLRFHPGGIAAVRAIADRDEISWTEAARRLLKYGCAHMPAGWVRDPEPRKAR